MGSSTGRLFRVTTFGESHGPAVGCVVEGCPPGLALSAAEVQAELDRRRPGASPLASPRREADRVEILSGVFEGRTLGTPIALLVRNRDADPQAYAPLREVYRPSHADWTTEARYGLRDWRGGGRASARETVGRVAAGAVARKVLAPARVTAWVEAVGPVAMGPLDEPLLQAPEAAAIEAHPVRCPDPAAAERMAALIEAVRAEGDSVGGVVRCLVTGLPAGLGDPVFDKLDADLARAMLSIPAAKGFAVGSGFSGAALRGSEHNDAFLPGPGGPRTATNRSGGVQGGISNGMPLDFRVAFKPVATIRREQDTVDAAGRPVRLSAAGRHDPCVVPRAVPIVEAMAALVLADHLLRLRAIRPDLPPS